MKKKRAVKKTRRAPEASARAAATLKAKLANAKQPVTLQITQRAADQLRHALGAGDINEAKAAVGLQVGEHLVWESSPPEFRSKLNALRVRDPQYRDMQFKLQRCTTFISAAFAFETLYIQRTA